MPCCTNSKINTLPSHRFWNAIKMKIMLKIMTKPHHYLCIHEMKFTIKIHMMCHRNEHILLHAQNLKAKKRKENEWKVKVRRKKTLRNKCVLKFLINLDTDKKKKKQNKKEIQKEEKQNEIYIMLLMVHLLSKSLCYKEKSLIACFTHIKVVDIRICCSL